MLGEVVRVAINSASHLDISAFAPVVVGRLNEAIREDFGMRDGTDGFCAERNGAVLIVGDATAWLGRQEKTETGFGFDGDFLGRGFTQRDG